MAHAAQLSAGTHRGAALPQALPEGRVAEPPRRVPRRERRRLLSAPLPLAPALLTPQVGVCCPGRDTRQQGGEQESRWQLRGLL